MSIISIADIGAQCSFNENIIEVTGLKWGQKCPIWSFLGQGDIVLKLKDSVVLNWMYGHPKLILF